MDSVTSATSATTTSSSGTTASSSGSKSAISSDFETFLRMLTTQLENQDPMNPLESSDFAVQLATFSGVEQQVRTNELIETLTENMGGTGLAQYGGWVGMEGRAAVPVAFDGTSPVTLLPEIDAGADSAQLVVRDAATNREVQRLDIPKDGAALDWSGTDAEGNTLAAGTYNLVVESFAAGAHISESPAEVYAPIAEVRSDADGVTVVFEGGGEASVGEVTALRPSGG